MPPLADPDKYRENERVLPDVIDLRGTPQQDLLGRLDGIADEQLHRLLTLIGVRDALKSYAVLLRGYAVLLRDQPSLAVRLADALDKLVDELKGIDPPKR